MNSTLFFAVSLDRPKGHGMADLMLHSFFEFGILYCQVIAIAAPNGFYKQTLHLFGCE